MEPRIQEAVTRIAKEVKSNKKLDEGMSETVERYVRRAVWQILAHCHREDIPEQLEDTAAQICEDMLIADGHIENPNNKEVSSISRGDTSISYRDPKSAYQNSVNFMKNYNCILVHFKKLNTPRDPKYDRS